MTETLKDKCRQQLGVADQTYTYYSLPELAKTYPSIKKLPYSLKVLLENLLRNHDGDTCLLYTSPSPRDRQKSRMPSSA